MLNISWLEFGGGVFWVLISIALLIALVNIESKGRTSILWPSSILIILGIILYATYRKEVGNWFSTIDMRILIYSLIGYVIFGIVWSFFKWFKFVRKEYKRYKFKLDEIVKKNREIEEEKRFSIGKESKYYPASLPDKAFYKPDATENKEQISAWILFWPLSALRYIIGNALVDFLNGIVDMFKGWYNAITEKQFSD